MLNYKDIDELIDDIKECPEEFTIWATVKTVEVIQGKEGKSYQRNTIQVDGVTVSFLTSVIDELTVGTECPVYLFKFFGLINAIFNLDENGISDFNKQAVKRQCEKILERRQAFIDSLPKETQGERLVKLQNNRFKNVTVNP